MKTHSCITSLVAFFIALTALAQGPLTPSGPPGPAMKTLQQIEPRTDVFNAPPAAVDTSDAGYHYIIQQPGSYYLSGNLAVTRANGIKIASPGVSLDLGGFQISRAGGTGGYGIEIAPTAHRCVVAHGKVQGFQDGVGVSLDAENNFAKAGRFEALVASGCRNGLGAGDDWQILACQAVENTSFAIGAGRASLIADCVAARNTGTIAISAGSGSTITCCTARDNGDPVFFDFAIHILDGGRVSDCVVSGSVDIGIRAEHATVERCSVSESGLDGISSVGRCVIRDNHLRANTRHGIDSGHGGDRIEGNTVVGNGKGINVSSANSLIIRNTARANNTNYEIGTGNRYGPIVDLTAAGTPAATGNSAPGTLGGSTDPWANFAH